MTMRFYFLCMTFAVSVAQAENIPSIDPALRTLAEAKIRSGSTPGLVIGTIVDNETRVQGFGTVSKNKASLPDANTIYEIGSITKTLTALLLADAASRGEVNLNDTLAKHLPNYQIPQFGKQPVTLLDLATQSSGLPRLPDNFQPQNPGNPYADYRAESLKTFLGNYHLPRAPGEKYEYSNLGFGVLGTAISTHAGKDYATLLAERITNPLAMHNTGITLNPFMRDYLAPGHDQTGRAVSNWDFQILAGAGALRSNVHDMLLYLQAHMHPQTVSKPAGLHLVQQAQRPTTVPGQQIALAWHIQQAGGQTVIWHNGMTGGYASFIGFTSDGKRGVVVLANASSSVDELGMAALLPAALSTTGQIPADKHLAPEILAQYVGRYQLAPGFVLTITTTPEGLQAQATGQSAAPVYPGKTDEFIYRIVDAQLQFKRDADGNVSSVVLHQNGRSMPAPRLNNQDGDLPSRDLKEITLSPDVLRQYLGRYTLAPGFSLVVSEEDGRIYIQATGQERSQFFPFKQDEIFSKLVDARISFTRGVNGAVNGLVLHQNGRDLPGQRSTE